MIPDDLEETRGGGGDVPPVRAEWGGLRLITQIGAGAFGRVYRAHDHALARDVALKIITLHNPEDATTILREGQMLARVRHQNVVTVHSVQRVGDEVGLVMELVDGETLADIVSTRGPMGAEEATLIGLALSQALAAVHAAGVVHRDVKARNVMRERGGRIVLMDFGLGLDASRGSDRQSTIAGTPPYMAPELFVDVPASVTSDLYSLGVLLFYLVTREYPVPDQGALASALAHAKREQRYLADLRPDLPPRFVEVVERAIKLDPALRFRSAGAMMLALSEARSPWKSRALAWTAGGLAAAGGVLGLGLLTSAAFNATLRRTGGFSNDTIVDWLAFGVRSLVTPVVYGVLLLAAWFALRTFWRVMRPGLRPIIERSGSSVERVGQAVGMRDPAGLGVWLLITQGIALAALVWWFSPVFELVVNFPDYVDTATVALFSQNSEVPVLYRRMLSLALIASVLLWRVLLRRPLAARRIDGATRTGAAIASLLTLLLLTLPYRLMFHNDRTVVQHGGLKCYELGERGDDRLVYCPAWDPPRIRTLTVGRDDIVDTGVRENLFTPP